MHPLVLKQWIKSRYIITIIYRSILIQQRLFVSDRIPDSVDTYSITVAQNNMI